MHRRRDQQYKCDILICNECGNRTTVPRMLGSRRARGHIKDMYCPYCKQITKFTEYQQEDFIRTMDGKWIGR